MKTIHDVLHPLPAIDDRAFGEAFDRYADAKVVLLGETSHGTSEFYRARAAITLRLVEEHGFSIICLEADWPDAAALDRFARDRPSAAAGEVPFARFPSWMWRNTDFDEFVQRLRRRNLSLPMDLRRGSMDSTSTICMARSTP